MSPAITSRGYGIGSGSKASSSGNRNSGGGGVSSAASSAAAAPPFASPPPPSSGNNNKSQAKQSLPPTTPRPAPLKRNARSRSAEEYNISSGGGVAGAAASDDQQIMPAASAAGLLLRSNFPPLSPSQRPPRDRAGNYHRSCRSVDGSILTMGGSASKNSSGSNASSGGGGGGNGLHPTARNLALDFFPEATAEGRLRPRMFCDTNNNEVNGPMNPLSRHCDDDDHDDDNDDVSSTASSFYSRNDQHHHHDEGGSIVDLDESSIIVSRSATDEEDGSSVYSHSDGEYSPHGDDTSDRSCESHKEYDDHQRNEDYDRGEPSAHNEKVAVIHHNQSMLSAPHSLDEGQLNDIFRRDGHYDSQKEIPRATEIYGSSASLSHRATRESSSSAAVVESTGKQNKQQQEQHLITSQQYFASPHYNDPGPPPLVESPDSDSSDRKQSPRYSSPKAKDETLSDLSNRSGNSIPRTVFYTPQVTPDAKEHPSAQNQTKGKSSRRQTDTSTTPMSLKSIQSAKIDFLCYGDPEEVPNVEGEDEYSVPLSPGSYLSTSALDASSELEDAARKAKAGDSNNKAQVISRSPIKQTSSSSMPLTPGNMYTVEDIVRASASAISRVLNLSLSDKVDENMEEITKQTYDRLQSRHM